ncbi:MAG: hypothetical protein GY822_01345, partial [Deltaproteobacteria bacterium]|nr:hypothetical protein [Deltaproteobacteria bacterium]
DAVDPLTPTVDALIDYTGSPTITGTVTLGSNETLDVTVNGTTYSSTGDVTVVGNDWSLDLFALSAPVTLADKTYEVTATVTDEAGNAASDTTTNELVVDTDRTDDVASVTSATPDGSYGIGQVITIDVQMERAVTVTTTLGSPTLTLNTTPVRNAAFAGAVGNTLSFTYTVQDGDTAADLDVSALNLNGAVIEDASGNQPSVSSIATLLSGAHDIVIDTTAPDAPTVDAQTTNSTTPTITGTSGTGAALNTGEILSVVVNGATYEVTPDGSGDWSLDLATTSPANGTLGAFVDGTYAVTATVTDEAGNAASDTTTNELVVDTTAPAAPTVDALITDLRDPTVSAPTITGTAVLGEGETLTVTVAGTTYNSSATGDVTVVGSDWSLDLSAVSPAVTLADETYEVTATVTDTAGNIVNDATTEELVIDTADPKIEFVTTPTADGTYGIGAVIDIDIQLSEAVIVNTALGSPTLTLNTTPPRHAEFTGAVGNILSFTYTSQDGDTAANLDVDALNLNGAVIEDAAGNAADDSNLGNTATLDAAIVINAVIPSATVTVTGLGDNYTYDVDQVIELTADFGTAVDVVGTPTISLLIGDNVVDATYATGSGTSEIKFRYEVQQAD